MMEGLSEFEGFGDVDDDLVAKDVLSIDAITYPKRLKMK